MGADVAAAVADSLEGGRVQDGRAAAWDAGRGGLTCWPVMALAAAAAGGVQLRVPGAACVCNRCMHAQTQPLTHAGVRCRGERGVWANEVARLVGSVPLSPPPVYGLMMDSSA
eukprot:scaffold199764_cov22-Tisochrysis_lutea.AAC.1